MDPKVVLILTWLIAGLVVAAYIWFVAWRYRAERRKKEAQAATDSAMSDKIARTAQQVQRGERSQPAGSAPDATEIEPAVAAAMAAAEPRATVAGAPAPATASPGTRMSEATVASLVSGIALPHDLVPLSTIGPRTAAGDRVAFWTDRAPAEVVGPAFADELERLGYTVRALDEQSLSAERGSDRLNVMVHPDGERATIGGELAFTTVPERSVVIEVWVPA
jgi:hypothetical protein